ncbi:MAG: S1 RNA-binding domain-containing protein [Anaerolineaceae bacterium]|nr:S1 RNA-binding domain-containing protein [Anaerolineaceae bacterium]
MAEIQDWNEQQSGGDNLDEGWWASLMADELEASKFNGKPEQANQVPEEKGEQKQDWELIRQLYKSDDVLPFEVRGYNRGGLLVAAEGIQGFVPVSHIVDMPCGLNDEQRLSFLAGFVGKQIDLKVIECEPSQERIVLSERAAQAGCGKRKELFDSLKPGVKVNGTVTNVTDFGVFIDLGGVEGLVHLSELSWGRVQHPSELVEVGKSVEAVVLQACEENCRVALSIKRLKQNPWEQLVKEFHAGDVLPATITSIMRFGAFARLDYGVEGLIHNSNLANLNAKEYHTTLQPGQHVQVEILHIDPDRRRLGLGLVTTL